MALASHCVCRRVRELNQGELVRPEAERNTRERVETVLRNQTKNFLANKSGWSVQYAERCLVKGVAIQPAARQFAAGMLTLATASFIQERSSPSLKLPSSLSPRVLLKPKSRSILASPFSARTRSSLAIAGASAEESKQTPHRAESQDVVSCTAARAAQLMWITDRPQQWNLRIH
jgi:hypothetical protein